MYLTQIKLETFPFFSHARTEEKIYLAISILHSKLVPAFSI